jgi:GNAT superfamily N-acetyltransferase
MSAARQFDLTLPATIRACCEADLPKLEWFGAFHHHRAIIREAFELQGRGEAVMLVAEAGGFPIGQAWLQLRHGCVPMVWAVRVLEPFQGRGVGARLMAALEDAAALLGHRDLELCVEQDNPKARAFYERLGWRLAGERRETYDYITPEGLSVTHDLREWVMTKQLDYASRVSPSRA